MSALRILSEIETAGACLHLLSVDDVDELKLRAAPGIVSPEMLAGIKANKAEIISILTKRGEVAHLPSWCRADCQRLAIIADVGPGCTHALVDGPCRHEWRHLDCLRKCSLKGGK